MRFVVVSVYLFPKQWLVWILWKRSVLRELGRKTVAPFKLTVIKLTVQYRETMLA